MKGMSQLDLRPVRFACSLEPLDIALDQDTLTRPIASSTTTIALQTEQRVLDIDFARSVTQAGRAAQGRRRQNHGASSTSRDASGQ